MTLTYWQWETSIPNSHQQTVIQTKIKDILVLIDVMSQMDLQTFTEHFFLPNTKDYTFFSAQTLGTLSKTGNALGHRASPKRYKKTDAQ